jgi:hypothetical protein
MHNRSLIWGANQEIESSTSTKCALACGRPATTTNDSVSNQSFVLRRMMNDAKELAALISAGEITSA